MVRDLDLRQGVALFKSHDKKLKHVFKTYVLVLHIFLSLVSKASEESI